MQDSTTIEFAYLFLAKGVHFNEIQRFVDAQPGADPNAETIPAPPPACDGSVDPTTVSTVPSPPAPRAWTASELLDFTEKQADFWDEVAGVVERMAG